MKELLENYWGFEFIPNFLMIKLNKKYIKIITYILAAFVFTGCANIRITNPPRTATEQFLLSQAAIEAISRFSFDPLFGRKVYVDSSHFAPDEKEFVLAEFRAGLFQAGIQILPDSNDADVILEVRSSGVGIDRYENLMGIPSLGAPSGIATLGPEAAAAASVITPELAITKNIKQIAFASIAYVAYWKESGEVVASEGPSTGKAYREDWWFLGMGPKTVSNIITVESDID